MNIESARGVSCSPCRKKKTSWKPFVGRQTPRLLCRRQINRRKMCAFYLDYDGQSIPLLRLGCRSLLPESSAFYFLLLLSLTDLPFFLFFVSPSVFCRSLLSLLPAFCLLPSLIFAKLLRATRDALAMLRRSAKALAHGRSAGSARAQTTPTARRVPQPFPLRASLPLVPDRSSADPPPACVPTALSIAS